MVAALSREGLRSWILACVSSGTARFVIWVMPTCLLLMAAIRVARSRRAWLFRRFKPLTSMTIRSGLIEERLVLWV